MRLIPKFLRRAEQRSIVASPDTLAAIFGAPTAAGVTVGPATAIGLPTISACVRVLAETIASLPLNVYQRTRDGKRRAPEHPLYRVLHDAPNRVHTSYTWREVSVGHILLWGNSYTLIGDGELIPLKPWSMRVEVKGGTVEYTYHLDNGGSRKIPAEDLIHVPGMSFDGLIGMSVISAHKQAISIGLAQESFNAAHLGNNLQPGGLLVHPGKLDSKARSNLREAFEARHKGSSKAGSMMLLEEGIKWEQVGIPAKDAQFIEGRKFQAEEYCRLFRVAPSMVGIQSNMPRANAEQEALGFVVHTIRPWLVRFEQAINRRLFEGTDYFAEFLVDGLLRGDTTTRYEAYASAITHGWMTRNEARALENLNPLPGLDEPLQPLNMTTAAQAANVANVDDGTRKNGHALVVEDGPRRIYAPSVLRLD
jgi:HK97 family phage portal protein